jgi:hypothetical protein
VRVSRPLPRPTARNSGPLDRHASGRRREILFEMTGHHFQDRATARQIMALAGGPLMLACGGSLCDDEREARCPA